MHTTDLLDAAARSSSTIEPATLVVTVFGVRIEIRADDGDLLDRVVPYLPFGRAATDSGAMDRTYTVVRAAGNRSDAPEAILAECIHGDAYQVFADQALLCQSRNLEELCERFQSDLELFVAVHARTRAIVHAGVVGWRGRAIVIPGPSCSGKTTLVSALIRRGADYYSDEYAVFDAQGLAHPCPKPLFIRHPRDERRRQTPEELGATVGQSRIPVGLILVTNYEPGATWTPNNLTPGQSALALLANSAAARYQPQYLLRTFREVVRRAVTLESSRGEAEDLADDLLSAIERQPL